MRALALIAILAARVWATGSAEDTEVVKDTFEDLVTAVVDADAESLIDGLHSSAHIRTARNPLTHLRAPSQSRSRSTGHSSPRRKA